MNPFFKAHPPIHGGASQLAISDTCRFLVVALVPQAAFVPSHFQVFSLIKPHPGPLRQEEKATQRCIGLQASMFASTK